MTAAAILAGAVGSVLRLTAAGSIQRRLASDWPWGTAAVNVVGAFVAGVAVGVGGPVAEVAAAACAGFTTFSTWMVEAVALWADGRSGHRRALVDLLIPLAFGLVAAAAGLAIGRGV